MTSSPPKLEPESSTVKSSYVMESSIENNSTQERSDSIIQNQKMDWMDQKTMKSSGSNLLAELESFHYKQTNESSSHYKRSYSSFNNNNQNSEYSYDTLSNSKDSKRNDRYDSRDEDVFAKRRRQSSDYRDYRDTKDTRDVWNSKDASIPTKIEPIRDTKRVDVWRSNDKKDEKRDSYHGSNDGKFKSRDSSIEHKPSRSKGKMARTSKLSSSESSIFKNNWF